MLKLQKDENLGKKMHQKGEKLLKMFSLFIG